MEKVVERRFHWAGLPVIVTVVRLLAMRSAAFFVLRVTGIEGLACLDGRASLIFIW